MTSDLCLARSPTSLTASAKRRPKRGTRPGGNRGGKNPLPGGNEKEITRSGHETQHQTETCQRQGASQGLKSLGKKSSSKKRGKRSQSEHDDLSPRTPWTLPPVTGKGA